jgi:biopolymer transport protein ExbD
MSGLRKDRRRFGRLPEEEVLSEINITPLTDVLLVLLIIFLLAAAAGVFGFNIRLPKGAPKKFKKNQFKGVMVTIPFWANTKKEVFVGGKLVSLQDLSYVLYKEHKKKKTHDVVMQIDKSVLYGIVIKVMDAAKSARLSHISFAAPLVPQ